MFTAELSVCSSGMVSNFSSGTVIRITNILELELKIVVCAAFIKYLLRESEAFWKPRGLLCICMRVGAYLYEWKCRRTTARLALTRELSTKCMGARSEPHPWKKSDRMALLTDG